MFSPYSDRRSKPLQTSPTKPKTVLGPQLCNRQLRRHRHDKRYLFTERAPILVFAESQALFAWMAVDEEHVARLHLCLPEQPCERRDHMALDRALQVARPISLVRPFLEQELPPLVGYFKREGDRR